MTPRDHNTRFAGGQAEVRSLVFIIYFKTGAHVAQAGRKLQYVAKGDLQFFVCLFVC